MMNRIFINTHNGDSGWILRILIEDIQREAEMLGYECNFGDYKDYKGEEIYYDFNYHIAVPVKEAKHNSVFYTHLNIDLDEKHLISMKNEFDSFICMSPEDAQFLLELGFDSKKVFGLTLPVRNTYIKPISIGIFSACYNDGRKNEAWLTEFCRENPLAQLANFVFIGPRWERVVKELGQYDCSSEWHNVSRKLPYEYQFQQNKLTNLDYYIYMGMDGGAMGTYDAYSQCVPLCVTFDGFHKSIPDLDYIFDNKEGFFTELTKIITKHKRRLDYFALHTPSNYLKWLIDVWEGKVENRITDEDKKCLSFHKVVDKKRSQYYRLNFLRFKIYLSTFIHRYMIKRSLK